MNGYLLIFFLGGPIILAIGNLVLGPIFNKKIPFKIQFRSFMVGTMVYLLGAVALYYLVLQDRFWLYILKQMTLYKTSVICFIKVEILMLHIQEQAV